MGSEIGGDVLATNTRLEFVPPRAERLQRIRGEPKERDTFTPVVWIPLSSDALGLKFGELLIASEGSSLGGNVGKATSPAW